MKNKKKHHINTFAAVDGVLLFVLSLICLLPIINVLAISFSSRAAADAGDAADVQDPWAGIDAEVEAINAETEDKDKE